MRYFKPNYSVFTLVADKTYNELNTFLLLGNYIFPNQATANLIYDHRTTPLLTTANSTQGQLVDSLDPLRQFFTEDQIRDLAEDRTAISDALTLGGSYPLDERFLLNGDVTLTSITGTDDSIGLNGAPDVSSTSRTGVEKFYGCSDRQQPIHQWRYIDCHVRYSTLRAFTLNSLSSDRGFAHQSGARFAYTHNDDDSGWTVEPLFRALSSAERMQLEFETGAEVVDRRSVERLDNLCGLFRQPGLSLRLLDVGGGPRYPHINLPVIIKLLPTTPTHRKVLSSRGV
jgi:hypothetical protein